MRLLVARAQDDAERTARRLAARGHQAVVAPVIAILPTGEAAPGGSFEGTILTSAHAVPALVGLGLHENPIFAVGSRTAAAARAAGAAEVREARGDAAALAAAVRESLAPGSRILHAAGRQRKAEPERSLRAAGYEFVVWEAYEAAAASALPEAARAALAAGGLDGALHYSRRSAQILLRLAQAAGLADALARIPHAGLSEDAMAPLRAVPGLIAAAAARPQERFLFEAIESLCRGSQAETR